MQSFAAKQCKTLLLLGAHADDIEIGCGGTVLALGEQHPDIAVHWAVMSATGERRREAEESANAFLSQFDVSTVRLSSFDDGFFPEQWGEIKRDFEKLKADVSPDLILTHYRHDLHQDHRVVSELTWNTFRDHAILEYEIPKYDGDFGSPNTYVQLNKDAVTQKIDNLLRHFPSQSKKAWFDRELFQGVMRLRGMECSAAEGYAEAYYAHKIRIDFGD